jgi:hypothetical protein
MSTRPGQFYNSIESNSQPVTAESAAKAIEQQFKANSKDHGDACAAYLQFRDEVVAYEKQTKADPNATKQFVDQVGVQLLKDGVLPPIQLAGVKYAVEVSQFKPADPKEQSVADKIKATSQDAGVQVLDQTIVAPATKAVTPDNLSAALQGEKDKAFQKLSPSETTQNQPPERTGQPQETPPETRPLPSESRARAEAERQILAQRLQDIESPNGKLANLKGTWDNATTLHDLGAVENYTGKYDDSVVHLKNSVDLMRKDLPGQPDAASKEKLLAQNLYDYGVALVRPKESDKQADKSQILDQRKQADAVFDEALKLADKNSLPPVQRADLLREKGDNQIFLATSNDPKTADGKTAFLQGLQTAEQTYSKGLDLLKQDSSNNGIASKAILTGNRGFAAMLEAAQPNDPAAQRAETDFAQSIQLWRGYKPEGDSTRALAENDSRDKAMLVVLAGYFKLLQSEGKENSDEAQKLKQDYQAIIDRHPDIQIKR